MNYMFFVFVACMTPQYINVIFLKNKIDGDKLCYLSTEERKETVNVLDKT